MTSLEAKREQFRKYLEKSGVIDALSRALIKLYEEPNKPDDAVRFIRKYLCESCPDDAAFDIMNADLDEARNKISELERELNRVKGNMKRTPSDVIALLQDGIKRMEDEDRQSVLRKYLTPSVLDELKNVKSAYGATLADCLNAEFTCPSGQKLAIYMGDHDCYAVFSKLVEPIIREYHGIAEDEEIKQAESNWGDPSTLKAIDPEGKYIKSLKIRASRNLNGFPLFPKMTEENFISVMGKVSAALMCLEGEYDGAFYSLEHIDKDTKMDLLKNHAIFDKINSILQEAGGYRFWPTGRGVYLNPPRTFAVWMNKEDHIQIISMSQTGNLPDVYRRLVNVVPLIRNNFTYQRDEKYGFITASPTNLGTALRASVHINLPKLSADFGKLQEICNSLNLEARTLPEEMGHTLEIANKQKLGITEYEVVTIFQEGILELISQETAK